MKLYTVIFAKPDDTLLYPVMIGDSMHYVPESEIFDTHYVVKAGLRIFDSVEAAHKYVARSKAQLGKYGKPTDDIVYAFEHYVVASLDTHICDFTHYKRDDK